MSETDILAPEQRIDSVTRRNEAIERQLGISLTFYSQLVEDAVFHATQPRPDAPLIPEEQVWVPIGPRNVGGRITALAQDPTNPLVLYAGSAHGGVWQTVDGGDTWEHLGEDEYNFPVGCIAIHENDPRALLVGTGLPVPEHASGRGLYRVTVPPPRLAPGPRDPAAFVRLAPAHPPGMPPAQVARNTAMHGASLRYTRIRFDPFDKDRFWAASQTGLWRWEPHPVTGSPRFILEFPPQKIESGHLVPPLVTTAAKSDQHYESYATDVLVAVDPRGNEPVSAGSSISRYLVIYVAIDRAGVYRGRFDRKTQEPKWERRLDVPEPSQNFERIQLALCERRPERIYALMSDGVKPTAVYRSNDSGESWTATSRPFDAAQNQAQYNLTLEVSPTDPDLVFAGVVEAFLSRNGGDDWQKTLFSRDHDELGDYAQHADQHAAAFDRFDRRRLWVGNDGGVTLAQDLQAPVRSAGYWRLRSHGIVGGQFQDIAVHSRPDRAFMTAGSAQDAGGWVGFGSPTWIHVNISDGGCFVFHPVVPGKFLASFPYAHIAGDVVPLTDQRTVVNPIVHDLPDTLAPAHAMAVRLGKFKIFQDETEKHSPFIPLIAQNPSPTQAGDVIFGWQRLANPDPKKDKVAAYYTREFDTDIKPLKGLIDDNAREGTEGRAACFGPAIPDRTKFEGWVGFSNGNVLRTDDAPHGDWVEPAESPWPADVAKQPISRIITHPNDERIVVVCTSGTPGQVFITYNRGRKWQNLTARVPSRVELTPATPSIAGGQRRQFTATAFFSDGDPLDVTTSVEWKTDPENSPAAQFSTVAGEEGQLITLAAGVVTVKATLTIFGTPVEGTTTVTVTAGSGSPPPLPSAARGFDLRALPPSPMAALAFDRDDPTRLFVGTLAGVYLLPNVPSPGKLTLGPTPAEVEVGETLQFTARCLFSDGIERDITTEVDWTAPALAGITFGDAAAGRASQVTGTLQGVFQVTARRGTESATIDITVNAATGAPPAPPDLPAAFAKPDVEIRWQPFNRGLPLTMVNDLAVVTGKNMLRAATFGRGIWDCDLTGATRPKHRLFIRQTIAEDGLADSRPFPPPLRRDPRVPLATLVELDHAHAFDIRADAPPFRFFDDRVDGVEFDERLGADTLVPGATNSIYVQVHNAGREPVPNVTVHLFFRASIAAPVGPKLDLAGVDLGDVADFYDFLRDFEPVAGASWARAGAPQTFEAVAPGTPLVVRFDWAPPAALANGNVALLALCSSPDDLPDPPPDPKVAKLIAAVRHVALRILPVGTLPRSDIYIRGGVDDDGRKSSGAAPARSPHIIVVQTPAARPRSDFADLLDLRPHDRLAGSKPNHIYVRVHNRGGATVRAEVEVWAVRVGSDLKPDFLPAKWTRVTTSKLDIDVPANDWELARVDWTPGDPAVDESTILIALAKSADGDDPLPNTTGIDSEEKFWRFLSRESGSDNVAARAVRWRKP